MTHTSQFLKETSEIALSIFDSDVENIAKELISLRNRGGRLFLLGLGGSAANCSHAVNDFRKLCGIEASTPVDNVAELTARANDEGWETIFHERFWKPKDDLFILSVGGGTGKVSLPLVRSLKYAKSLGMKILGIVGRDGGYTKQVGDFVVVVPTPCPDRVTPHTEAFQSVILHCLVSHPDLQTKPTKW